MCFENYRAGAGQQAADSRRLPDLPNAYSLQPTASPQRGAMTLVELLVVIVLVSTLVATAIPIISPGGDSRKLREASRNLNAYLQGAQARAMQTGRPFGVAFRRLSEVTERGEDNAVCVRVEYVEVPPTYSGFSETSSVRLAINPAYTAYLAGADNDPNAFGIDDAGPMLLQFVARGNGATATLPAGWQADLVPPRFLRPGDTIEVGGRRYTLLSPTNALPALSPNNGYFEPATTQLVTLAVRPAEALDPTPPGQLPMLNYAYDESGQLISSPEALSITAAGSPGPSTALYWTEPQPYKVLRQPTPAAGEPLELPTGMAVDLQASVLGGSPITRLYDPALDYIGGTEPFDVIDDPILLLFAPEGHVQRLYGLLDSSTLATFGPRRQLAPRTVTSFVALCIGRRELIPAAPFGAAADNLSVASYRDPININPPNSDPPAAYDPEVPFADEAAFRELTDQYNWLNLDSRWVVVGGQSGAVVTVENVTPDVTNPAQLTTTAGQLFGALENARARTKIGGR